jgi:hypothetical protein
MCDGYPIDRGVLAGYAFTFKCVKIKIRSHFAFNYPYVCLFYASGYYHFNSESTFFAESKYQVRISVK